MVVADLPGVHDPVPAPICVALVVAATSGDRQAEPCASTNSTYPLTGWSLLFDGGDRLSARADEKDRTE